MEMAVLVVDSHATEATTDEDDTAVLRYDRHDLVFWNRPFGNDLPTRAILLFLPLYVQTTRCTRKLTTTYKQQRSTIIIMIHDECSLQLLY